MTKWQDIDKLRPSIVSNSKTFPEKKIHRKAGTSGKKSKQKYKMWPILLKKASRFSHNLEKGSWILRFSSNFPWLTGKLYKTLQIFYQLALERNSHDSNDYFFFEKKLLLTMLLFGLSYRGPILYQSYPFTHKPLTKTDYISFYYEHYLLLSFIIRSLHNISTLNFEDLKVKDWDHLIGLILHIFIIHLKVFSIPWFP